MDGWDFGGMSIELPLSFTGKPQELHRNSAGSHMLKQHMMLPNDVVAAAAGGGGDDSADGGAGAGGATVGRAGAGATVGGAGSGACAGGCCFCKVFLCGPCLAGRVLEGFSTTMFFWQVYVIGCPAQDCVALRSKAPSCRTAWSALSTCHCFAHPAS